MDSLKDAGCREKRKCWSRMHSYANVLAIQLYLKAKRKKFVKIEHLRMLRENIVENKRITKK